MKKPPLPWTVVLEACLKVLALVQTMLPAVLVAWAGKERRAADNARAEGVIASGRGAGAEAEVRILETTRGLGRRALLDRALAQARLRAKPSPE